MSNSIDSNTIDEAKGRVKQAAGDLTDNEDLKREGKIDEFVADVKDRVDDAADKVKELFDRNKS